MSAKKSRWERRGFSLRQEPMTCMRTLPFHLRKTCWRSIHTAAVTYQFLCHVCNNRSWSVEGLCDKGTCAPLPQTLCLPDCQHTSLRVHIITESTSAEHKPLQNLKCQFTIFFLHFLIVCICPFTLILTSLYKNKSKCVRSSKVHAAHARLWMFSKLATVETITHKYVHIALLALIYSFTKDNKIWTPQILVTLCAIFSNIHLILI